MIYGKMSALSRLLFSLCLTIWTADQRESGKWFTPSPVNEARNLISNTGSAYAVLALQACGVLPGWPFGD